MINRQRVLQEFMEMVAIASPSGGEREIADVLMQKLQAAGLAVEEDGAGEKIGGNAGNLIARLSATVPGAPVLMLSAHMDSVQPCAGIRPQLNDGVITSAGDTILGADCRSGIVPLLEALRQIQEQSLPHGEIVVVFTISEEAGLDGAIHIDPTKIRADFGYALDGEEVGSVTTMAPGQNSLAIVVRGKTAHAGVAPEEGINAITLAARALAVIPQGRIDFETTCNVGVIKGGAATNIVPDRVEISAEVRSRNLDKLGRLTREIADTFSRIVTAGGGQVEIGVKRAYEPFVLAETAPVIATAVKAAAAAGIAARVEATGGGSDANFFNRYNVPTAILGTGMAKVHTTAEFIREDDLYRTTEWTLAIIREAAGLSPSI
ncbi:MAG: M20/M25/M40 family metallo-hydrolase [Veillonellaceae bacterium]|nr:M20/M25/M40 family metallo-hydrolase [Veillonellaceae bacterium]